MCAKHWHPQGAQGDPWCSHTLPAPFEHRIQRMPRRNFKSVWKSRRPSYAEASSCKPKKIQAGNSKHLQTQQVQTRSIKALPGISKVLECTGKWFDMHTCTTCMKEAHRAHLPKAPFPFSRRTGFHFCCKTNRKP